MIPLSFSIYHEDHCRELRVPLISWDLMVELIAGLRKYENNDDEMVKHANKILNKLDKYHK